MKKLLIIILPFLIATEVFAQNNTDSIAYEQQRKKINSLLTIREAKFGQYDVSLTKHTGIFGLQTKKDIRRSNEILMDIAQADNHIFKELKILLDYRTFQQNQAQNVSKQLENDRSAFINSLNRLRKQNEDLKEKVAQHNEAIEKSEKKYTISMLLAAVIVFLLSLKLIQLTRRNRKGAAT